jgi:hypothetical protein
MPFKGQYAFISTTEVASHELPRTLAHELAHGTFRLYHTFSDKNNYPVPKGTTDNLMDYNNGKQLHKYQWDNIQDPRNILFAGLIDEEEEAMEDYYKLVNSRITAFINKLATKNNSTYIFDVEKFKRNKNIVRNVFASPNYPYMSGYETSPYIKLSINSYNITNPDTKNIINTYNPKIKIVWDDEKKKHNLIFLLKFYRIDSKDDTPGLSFELLYYDDIMALIQEINLDSDSHKKSIKQKFINTLRQTNNRKLIVALIEHFPESFLINALSISRLKDIIKLLVNSSMDKKECKIVSKLLKSVSSANEAKEIINWMKDEYTIKRQLLKSINSLSDDNFTYLATGITHLYYTQNKDDILSKGKDVNQENFFIWNPLGNSDNFDLNSMSDVWDMKKNAYITTYKVFPEDEGTFDVDVTRSYNSGPKTQTIAINPFETVSVYFATKNEHIGIKDYTVAMPGIYLAWLIDQKERQANKAVANLGLTAASFAFPVSALSNALRSGKYLNSLWQGFLVCKTITDNILKNEQIRFLAKKEFGNTFFSAYIAISKIIDASLLYKNFAKEEYLEASTTFVNEWDNINQKKKQNFKEQYPEKFKLLKEKINQLESNN